MCNVLRRIAAPVVVAAWVLVGARVAAPEEPAGGATSYLPVVTPDGSTLPWKLVDGVKVFHLVAEPVKCEVAPGHVFNVWGYNGRSPGPTIEAVEGDRVRIYVTNRLAEPTSVHWHGVLLPNGMDGVAGLTQPTIKPGETFKYEFTLRQHGTLMYHPHSDEMVQIGMGMMGFFVIHPKDGSGPRVDRDYALMTHEWFVKPGTTTPDPTVMLDFNLFTFNGRASPGTTPLIAKRGERVRIRIGNLSMNSHPIHLHGFQFKVTATDGGPIAASAQWPETTVNVPVGATRDVEFVADEPGDWALHCHKTHHVMNQMGHGLPLLLGVSQEGLEDKISRLLPDYMAMGKAGMGEPMMGMKGPRNTLAMGGPLGPFGEIDMGGMFTVLKVRDEVTGSEIPGWYTHPSGTVAAPASTDELKRDVDGEKAPAQPSPKHPGHGGD